MEPFQNNPIPILILYLRNDTDTKWYSVPILFEFSDSLAGGLHNNFAAFCISTSRYLYDKGANMEQWWYCASKDMHNMRDLKQNKPLFVHDWTELNSQVSVSSIICTLVKRYYFCCLSDTKSIGTVVRLQALIKTILKLFFRSWFLASPVQRPCDILASKCYETMWSSHRKSSYHQSPGGTTCLAQSYTTHGCSRHAYKCVTETGHRGNGNCLQTISSISHCTSHEMETEVRHLCGAIFIYIIFLNHYIWHDYFQNYW